MKQEDHKNVHKNSPSPPLKSDLCGSQSRALLRHYTQFYI